MGEEAVLAARQMRRGVADIPMITATARQGKSQELDRVEMGERRAQSWGLQKPVRDNEQGVEAWIRRGLDGADARVCPEGGSECRAGGVG